MIFALWTGIFEIAGLKDEYGNKRIYPEMDWSEDAVIPIIIVLISIIIEVIFTLLLTFIKNLILIKSGIGQRCTEIDEDDEDDEDNYGLGMKSTKL